jgi:aldehyde:ferredoxin oxidoreductase
MSTENSANKKSPANGYEALIITPKSLKGTWLRIKHKSIGINDASDAKSPP